MYALIAVFTFLVVLYFLWVLLCGLWQTSKWLFGVETEQQKMDREWVRYEKWLEQFKHQPSLQAFPVEANPIRGIHGIGAVYRQRAVRRYHDSRRIGALRLPMPDDC